MFIRTISFWGFRKWRFLGLAITRDLPLDIPGAETPKHHVSSALLSFWVSQIEISGLVSTRDSPLDISGAETPKHHVSSTLLSF
jgi:hypothetical protein